MVYTKHVLSSVRLIVVAIFIGYEVEREERLQFYVSFYLVKNSNIAFLMSLQLYDIISFLFSLFNGSGTRDGNISTMYFKTTELELFLIEIRYE